MPSARAICQSAPPGTTSPSRRGALTRPPRIGTKRRPPRGMAPNSRIGPTVTVMSQTWASSGVVSMLNSQKVGGGQQGGEGNARRLEGILGTFLPVDHGNRRHDHGAFGPERLDRL